MKPFKLCSALAFLGLAVALSGAANPKPTLDIAHEIADTTFKGKTYAEVDCVHFVLAVVEAKLGLNLKPDLRSAILIAYNWSPVEVQSIADAGTDPRLDGVAYALCTLSSYGSRVAPADARPGDLIQYWMKKSDGTWFGHSGVISKVEAGKAVIYGAQQRQNKIADTTFNLNLFGDQRKIAIVRID